jgi:small subunit ribosomal protein S9
MAEIKKYISTTGKRKEAVARIRVYIDLKETILIGEKPVKKGDVFVNNFLIEDYFKGMVFKAYYEEPFKITNNLGKYTITAKVEGGGQKSQLDAFIHGVAKALSSIDEKNKSILKKKGFLTRDSRIRQRRKVGMGGKSRRKRQSPKR